MPPRNVMLMARTLGHGGTERQLTETALCLNRDLFTPHVGCVQGDGFRADQLRKSGVPILELPFTSYASRECFTSVVNLRRYWRQHRISLVHTFDTQMNIFGVPVAKLPGGPVVLSSQRCFENVIWPPHRRLNRIAHFLSDGVVINCQILEQHMQQVYSVPRRKIEICPNGIDTSVFAPGPTPRPRPEGLRDADVVIGSVCVLRPEKGLTTLLEAFALMRSGLTQVRSLRLVIVGSGPVREALEAQARELGIGGECLFYPTTEDVSSWLHAIDVFVLPSLSEAFSNSLMEAMACGCCAIASNVGGNPELVREEETGLLFESENASELANQLRRVVLDDALRNRLAKAGSDWVSTRLSREVAASRMEEIYVHYLRPV
jgi:glycosyltransferase involved in cell wall biosynthesis